MTEVKILFSRLPVDLHMRLKIAAAVDGRPMSKLVVEAITQYLDRTQEASNG